MWVTCRHPKGYLFGFPAAALQMLLPYWVPQPFHLLPCIPSHVWTLTLPSRPPRPCPTSTGWNVNISSLGIMRIAYYARARVRVRSRATPLNHWGVWREITRLSFAILLKNTFSRIKFGQGSSHQLWGWNFAGEFFRHPLYAKYGKALLEAWSMKTLTAKFYFLSGIWQNHEIPRKF